MESGLLSRQKEYIFGALLGDACIKMPKHCRNAFFCVAQTYKNYVKFQFEILKNFTRAGVKEYSDKRENRKNIFYFNTICDPIFTKIYKKLYIHGRKTISYGWLNLLTSFSLAIWYMDDGSITKSTHQMRISTESFTLKEHLLLQNFLKNKFDINAKISKSPKRGKWILLFTAEERNKFFKLIAPHVVPALEYKILRKSFKWNKWKPVEIELLKKNYYGRDSNWKKLTQSLNHPKSAILRKASYLGLSA